jgi:hypothetical protein
VPGAGAGDNLTFLWNSWWARHVWASGQLAGYFHTSYLFAPFGAPLVLNTHTALESFTTAVLGGVPLVRAHNLVLIAGLASNGFATYWLALQFVRRPLPALLAGTSFATCAYLTLHLLGHVNLTHAWTLPVAIAAWCSFVAVPSARRAAAAAAAFAAAAWSDYYYLVFATIFAVVWLTVTVWDVRIAWRSSGNRVVERTLLALAVVAGAIAATIWMTGGIALTIGGVHVTAQQPRNPTSLAGICLLGWALIRSRVSAIAVRELSWSALARSSAIGLAIFGLLTAPLLIAGIGLVRSGGYASQSYFWRSGPRGVDLATAVLGPPMHTLTGGLTSALDRQLSIERIEQTAWLGLVTSVLLVAAIRRLSVLGSDARRWLWVWAIFVVWSLGPSLSIAGIDTGLLLPQTLVRFVPVLSNARMPGRAIVMVQLASAVLGAMVVTRLSWKPRTLLLLVGAVVLESLTAPFPLYRLPPADAIDASLADASGAVVELPSGLRDGFGEWGRFDSRALVHQIGHGRPLVGGFSARLAPSVTAAYRNDRPLSSLFDLSSGIITADALPQDLGTSLTRSAITHVVVNTDMMPDVREPFERRGLRLVAEVGPRQLFAVVR